MRPILLAGNTACSLVAAHQDACDAGLCRAVATAEEEQLVARFVVVIVEQIKPQRQSAAERQSAEERGARAERALDS